ncbi:MAG: hypothetical protein ACD_29C00307G0003 [uncultured bacterium]|nr:MAG: hypothetical protein ACD_29C00307G0003 [uncultured bacterium]
MLTGVRRCGKSVLLNMLRQQSKEKDYFFNFEDERLVTFSLNDFQLLYEIFDDAERLLENIVFIELKRRFQQIYYHKEKKNAISLFKKI